MTRDTYSLAIYAAELAGNHEEAARLKRAKTTRSHMSTHDNTFRDVLAGLGTNIETPAGELATFEAEAAAAKKRGTPYSAAYYSGEKEKILARIKEADATALASMSTWVATALADARSTRAAAEAGRDATSRVADEMERSRLMASPLDGSVFERQAREALAAGQPRRASFLLSVALDKGFKGGFETDPETGSPVAALPRLLQGIEDAIDAIEPDRQSARSLEESVKVNRYAFAVERKRLLAKFGIGVREDGTIGSAHPSDIARASISAKTAALREAQVRGGFYTPAGYRDPEGVS